MQVPSSRARALEGHRLQVQQIGEDLQGILDPMVQLFVEHLSLTQRGLQGGIRRGEVRGAGLDLLLNVEEDRRRPVGLLNAAMEVGHQVAVEGELQQLLIAQLVVQRGFLYLGQLVVERSQLFTGHVQRFHGLDEEGGEVRCRASAA
jgi:hypothetical protein